MVLNKGAFELVPLKISKESDGSILIRSTHNTMLSPQGSIKKPGQPVNWPRV